MNTTITTTQPVAIAPEIQTRAVLVRVFAPVYQPRRKNKTAIEEFCTTHGVDRSMHNASDALFPREFLAELTAVKTEITQQMARLAPWDDNGTRILPVELSVDFMDRIAGLGRKWGDAVDRFVRSWPNIVDDARRRLNGQFNPDNYPTAEEMRERFPWSVTYAPLPVGGHFVVDAPAEMLREFQSSFDVDNLQRIQQSTVYLKEQFAEKLGAIVKKCVSFEPGKSRIHASLLTSLEALVDDLPKLVLTDDPAFLAAVDDARRLVRTTDIDALREDDSARKSVVEGARSILTAIQF